MTVTIAQLQSHEMAEFRSLLDVFKTVFDREDETPSPLPIPDDAYLAVTLQDTNFAAIVARSESGLIVGGLTLRFWYSYQQEGAECYLYDLAILAEYRRRGIASALVRSAIECATARGAIAMWVQAEADDHNAVAFYRTLKQSEMNVSHFELL